MTDRDTIRSTLPRAEILAQLAEECAELAQAALKLRRAISGENPTPVTVLYAEESLDEEVADVLLCISFAGEYMYGYDCDFSEDTRNAMERKMRRWARRLREAQGK